VCSGSMGSTTSLTKLNLSGTHLRDAGAARIAQALTQAPEIRSVAVADCKFQDPAGALFAALLSTLASLQDLDLSGNSLGERSCNALVAGLPLASYLTALRLSRCGLSDEAGATICFALQTSFSWSIVSLAGEPAVGLSADRCTRLPVT
jgi:Ran GTPase-activating protein (RanGAP) involved in mRNA processing and transport